VLPIGGFLGNVPAPALATLQADIGRGYVRAFVLPVSPPGPDPRVRWIESHCPRQPPAPEPPSGPVRQLLLRGPGTSQPAGCPSDQSTNRMMPPCQRYPARIGLKRACRGSPIAGKRMSHRPYQICHSVRA
jgi:hypothetical protein